VDQVKTKAEAPKASFFCNYREHIAAFTQNARLYLTRSILLGIVMGIFQLLFNFYVLSLGFNQEVLGTLVSFRNATSLLIARHGGFAFQHVFQFWVGNQPGTERLAANPQRIYGLIPVYDCHIFAGCVVVLPLAFARR